MSQQNKKSPEITLLLVVKNEAENLQHNYNWLDKCKSINEIVAVDDCSSDDTKKIIEKLSSKKRKVKIFDRELSKDFASQRNFGVSKSSNDWILWLDADERPSEKLIRFINHIDINRYNAFSFKRTDIFLGKKLNHGETAKQSFTRLFNKTNGKFVGSVHEIWKTNKNIINRKDVEILHYSHRTLKSFIQKINFYSDIRAKELFDQKIKASIFDIIIYPTGKFIQNYIFKAGFLDGTPGIIMALGMSFHSFLVRAKLWHLYQN
jgi:glycosyltransferase involved in cell wall biosynthesis